MQYTVCMKKSHLLVGIQFMLIALIVWYCGVQGELWQNVITGMALVLGIWAITVMKFRVSVLPDVRDTQELHTGGPYRYIRHPMYTAVLLSTSVWLFNRLDSIAIVLWLLLFADLLVKLRYEEGLLLAKFPQYKEYAHNTKRLVPFIF